MRIKTIDELRGRVGTTVYICMLSDSMEPVNNNGIIPASDLRERCKIIPCKIIQDNAKPAGYRMDGGMGKSFEAEKVESYILKPITKKEARRMNVPVSFYDAVCTNRVTSIPFNAGEYNAISIYEGLTTFDGEKYSRYTVDSICSSDSNGTQDDLVYHDKITPVFTEYSEAKYYIEKTIKEIVRKIAGVINERAEWEKEKYYNLAKAVEYNDTDIY